MESIIIAALSPVFVYLGTKLALWVKPNIPSAIVTTILVPVLSGLSGWLSSLVTPDLSWYYVAAIGLAGTFIHEFLNNIKKAIGL